MNLISKLLIVICILSVEWVYIYTAQRAAAAAAAEWRALALWLTFLLLLVVSETGDKTADYVDGWQIIVLRLNRTLSDLIHGQTAADDEIICAITTAKLQAIYAGILHSYKTTPELNRNFLR